MLDQLSMSQERLSEATASFGARLNTLDNAEFSNTDFQLMTEGTLSAVQDLDYVAASTELAKRQLALEAAYASFAKIQGLSLFNYIN
jgi:flagellin-like hook-associated protein FlgL